MSDHEKVWINVHRAKSRKRVLWVVEELFRGSWVPSEPRESRAQARLMLNYLVREYGVDPAKMRIRAYVPDPFLNRDRRPSR